MPVTTLRLPHEVLTEESLHLVRQYLEETQAQVVQLDLSGLQLPTAEGLGALVVLNRELRARGGGLSLINVPPASYEVFCLTNLIDVLDVQDTAGAVAARDDANGLAIPRPIHAK